MTKRQGKFLMGIDPGLRNMGWGIIDVVGSRIHHVANGNLTSQSNKSLGERLACLYKGLEAVLADYRPDGVAVEKTFVSKDPVSTLKLGQARGVAVLVPALASLPVAEYAPNVIKKSLVGAGHADKQQIRVMVGALLPTCEIASDDAADALAVAICHAHHSATAERILTAVHGDALKARQKRSITS